MKQIISFKLFETNSLNESKQNPIQLPNIDVELVEFKNGFLYIGMLNELVLFHVSKKRLERDIRTKGIFKNLKSINDLTNEQLINIERFLLDYFTNCLNDFD